MTSSTIKTAAASICSIMDEMQKISHLWDIELDRQQDYCLAIPELMDSGKIRLAVVGAIKSGKSTFINSLLKKEVVQRGAGVKTSITTKIAKGRKNLARLTFASWDAINQLLRKSLLAFPEEILHRPKDLELNTLDIRRKKDRSFLAEAEKSIAREFPVTSEGFFPEAVAISHALEGYESCKDFVKADPASVVFESKDMAKHMQFTSDPNKAFYVSDVSLQVYAPSLVPYLEIADCQGTDSTDPAQLEKIIHYIESANLMVYCISSRHGLRKADMSFLSIIRESGLMDNILFCINCDLSEHNDINELENIIQKTVHDLRYFVPDPGVFPFSFLHDLFEHLGSKLSPKDQLRQNMWKKEKPLAELCAKNSEKFHEYLNHLLEQKRSDLLVSNHIQRLNIITRKMREKMIQALELLSADQEKQQTLFRQSLEKKSRARQMQSVVQASVAISVSDLKKEMKKEITSFFVQGNNCLFQEIRTLINQTDLFTESFKSSPGQTSVSRIPYRMFQTLKHQVDQHAVKKSLPKIKAHTARQEQTLYQWWDALMDSFAPGQESIKSDIISDTPRISHMETILDITLPPPVFACTYNRQAQIRAVGGMGLQGLWSFFEAILSRRKKRSAKLWLKRAEREVKRQCIREMHQQISQYTQTLWNQYYDPLISGFSRDITEKIRLRLDESVLVSQNMEKVMALEDKKKKEQIEKIHAMQYKLQSVSQSLARIEQAHDK